MNSSVEYLVHFLEDEFRDFPEVKVRSVAPSSTRKAPDLDQSYDPESNDLHVKEGVTLKVGSRDYFFPSDWVRTKNFAAIRQLAHEIRERILAF